MCKAIGQKISWRYKTSHKEEIAYLRLDSGCWYHVGDCSLFPSRLRVSAAKLHVRAVESHGPTRVAHLQCTCGNDIPSYGPNFIVPVNCKPPTELRLQIFQISAQPRSIHITQHQAESYEQLIAKRRMHTILSPLISGSFGWRWWDTIISWFTTIIMEDLLGFTLNTKLTLLNSHD